MSIVKFKQICSHEGLYQEDSPNLGWCRWALRLVGSSSGRHAWDAGLGGDPQLEASFVVTYSMLALAREEPRGFWDVWIWLISFMKSKSLAAGTVKRPTSPSGKPQQERRFGIGSIRETVLGDFSYARCFALRRLILHTWWCRGHCLGSTGWCFEGRACITLVLIEGPVWLEVRKLGGVGMEHWQAASEVSDTWGSTPGGYGAGVRLRESCVCRCLTVGIGGTPHQPEYLF